MHTSLARVGLLAVAALGLLSSPVIGGVYRLNEPDLFDQHPFGFSGEVVTDGSVGEFLTTDFITSWRITVETPGETDGVTSEVLTPANSSVEFSANATSGVMVTPDHILMPSLIGSPLVSLTWSTLDGETELQFTNRFVRPDGLGAGASVFDPSETNNALGIVSEFAVASVPEPSGAVIAFVLASAVIGRRVSRSAQAPGRHPC